MQFAREKKTLSMVCSIILEKSTTGIQTCLILESDQKLEEVYRNSFYTVA